MLFNVVEYEESEAASSTEQVSTFELLMVKDWDLICSYFLIFVEIDVKVSTNERKSAQGIVVDLWDLLLAELIAFVTLVIASTIVSYFVIFVLISDWVREESVIADSEETLSIVEMNIVGEGGRSVENPKVVVERKSVVSLVENGDDNL